MRIITVLILIFFLVFTCRKKVEMIPEDVTIFGIESLKIYENYILSSRDSEIDKDESIIVVGNGSENGNPQVTPFFLRIDVDGQLSNIDFLTSDYISNFRSIDLLPTQDGDFIYLSSFRNNSSLDIDIRKISANGEVEWEKRIGESDIDERAISITQLPNADYLVLSVIDQDISSLLSDNYSLTRISPDGNKIWAKTIEDTNIYSLRRIQYLPQDNSILVLNEYGPNFTNSGQIKVTKFNLDGEFILNKVIGDQINYYPLSSDMKILNDGNILIYYSEQPQDFSGSHAIKMVKLDNELEELWIREPNNVESNIIRDIVEIRNNDMMLLSMTSSIGNGGLDVVLSKMNNNGEIDWTKVFGSMDSDQGLRLHEKPNKDLVIIGSTNHNTASESIFNLFYLVTDNEGNPK